MASLDCYRITKKLYRKTGYILLVFTHICSGYAAAPLPNKSVTMQSLQLQGIYTYRDFSFKSSTGLNYNQYNGHSNAYMAGANNIQLGNKIRAGLAYINTHLNLTSNILISPTPLFRTLQYIAGNAIAGHLAKQMTDQFTLDVSAGYQQFKMNYHTVMAPNTTNAQYSQSWGHSDDWFAGVSGIYFKQWKKLLFISSLNYLHNELRQASFIAPFYPSFSTNIIAPITNKSSYLLENIEVAYQHDKASPFVNAGLLQVTQYSNNRTLFSGVPIGGLPLLNLNQNGYHLGAGINFPIKNFVFRLEQQYIKRGHVYHDNLSIASLKMALD